MMAPGSSFADRIHTRNIAVNAARTAIDAQPGAWEDLKAQLAGLEQLIANRSQGKTTLMKCYQMKPRHAHTGASLRADLAQLIQTYSNPHLLEGSKSLGIGAVFKLGSKAFDPNFLDQIRKSCKGKRPRELDDEEIGDSEGSSTSGSDGSEADEAYVPRSGKSSLAARSVMPNNAKVPALTSNCLPSLAAERPQKKTFSKDAKVVPAAARQVCECKDIRESIINSCGTGSGKSKPCRHRRT